jgi:hypothetical protein
MEKQWRKHQILLVILLKGDVGSINIFVWLYYKKSLHNVYSLPSIDMLLHTDFMESSVNQNIPGGFWTCGIVRKQPAVVSDDATVWERSVSTAYLFITLKIS